MTKTPKNAKGSKGIEQDFVGNSKLQLLVIRENANKRKHYDGESKKTYYILVNFHDKKKRNVSRETLL